VGEAACGSGLAWSRTVSSRSAPHSMLGIPTAVHHIVQIGGGPGLFGPHLRAADAAKTWLVEADPQAALRLRVRLEGTRTTVLGAVLAPRAGPLTWHVHEPRSFDGPHPMSKALRDLCHGATERSSRVVDASAVGDFLATLPQPRQNSVAALVVDRPNGGADLVCALDADALQRYDWIVVRLAADFAFVGAATDRHVREHLSLCGYRCTDAVDPALFPFQHFAIDRAGIENARLQSALNTLQRELAVAKDVADAALAQARHRLETSEALANDVLHLKEQLAQAQREADRSATRLALRESELAASGEVAAQVPRLKGQLAQAQRESEHSATMLALRESDLRDLQQRYEEALRLQDAYRDTLHELTARVKEWLSRSGNEPAA
jgi:hypothetical protein